MDMHSLDRSSFDGVSTDRLQSELVRLESLRRRLAALEVELIAEADRRQVPTADGARTLTDWVVAVLDVRRDTAKDLVHLTKTLGVLPSTRERLVSGESSVERAATLSRVATETTESEWWDRTRGFDLSGTERYVARHRRLTRSQERRDHSDSYVWLQPRLDRSWWNLHGGLPAHAGQVISDALRSQADQYPKDAGPLSHRQALALEELATTTGGDVPVPSITVFVDLDVANGTGAETGAELASGPRVGPDTLEELLCTGTAAIVGLKDAKPVITSRRSRTIPRSVRDYVLWRDGGCVARGCNSRRLLQPHHVVPWSHGGTHDPDGLKTLCWYHHHVVVHRRGMRIVPQEDGTIRFATPTDSRDPP